MALNGRSTRVYGQIVREDGTCLCNYDYICFGQSLNYTEDFRKDKTAKYYDFYFADKVTEHFKGDTSYTDAYLSLLDEANYRKTAEVSRVEKCPEDIPKSKYMLRLRLPLDEATGQEMFLTGCLIRVLENSPQLVLDCLQLNSLHPDIDKSLLVLMAHVISFSDKYRSQNISDVLISPSSSVLTGKTFKDFYKDTSKKPKLRTSTNYLGLPKVTYMQNYFVHSNIRMPYYHQPTKRSLETTLYRVSGVEYKPEVIETFLDVEKAKKFMYTKTFCRNPFIQPPQEK